MSFYNKKSETLYIFRHFTLLVQDFRQQKNQPIPIQHSRPSRDSQKPKTTKKFQISRVLFQKIPLLYFFLHKSWIWQTLEHNTKKFLIAIFIMLQKNAFGQKNFKFHAPGSTKSRIYAEKSAKRRFSKKAIARIEIFLLFQVSMNIPKAWNDKVEVASFFAV